MKNETRRRLAFICCSVAAFALASCGDESSTPSTDEDKCGDSVCTSEQACVDNVCVPKNDDDACLENGVMKDCGEGKVCSKGECVPSGCVDMVCDEGWQCVTGDCDANNVCTGVCVETVCIDYFCEEGRTCRGGACVDNECLDMTCDEGLVCSKGNCTYEICIGKEACSTGKACNSEGNCEFVVPPAISLDEPEDKTTDETGDTTTLTLHLNNMPAADVTVNCEIVTESPNQEVEHTCGEIVFTSENWNVPQEVIMTGIEDYKKDGDQVYKVKMTTVSEDLEFVDLVAESVELTNLDKTVPGFVFSKTALTTYEDQTLEADTFTVQLSSIPNDDVNVTLASSNELEGVVTPTSLTFTSENWNVPQTVTVKGVDDKRQDGSTGYTVFISSTESEDLDYNEMTPSPITVMNVDNDVAGITMTTEEVFVVTEGLTADVPVRLNTMPKSDVTITVTVSDEKEVSVDVKELVLTPENWHEGIVLHVSGVLDDVMDGDKLISLTFAVTSEDTDYNGIEVMTIEGTVKDVDKADIVVNSNSESFHENSSSQASIGVRLLSQPTANVVVNVMSSDASELMIESGNSLTFTSSNWKNEQTVIVKAVDDSIADSTQTAYANFTVTSSDLNFNGMTGQSALYTIIDDETPSIVLTVPQSTIDAANPTMTANVMLGAQPVGDVTVSLSTSNPNVLEFNPSTVTMTPDDWNVPKPVTVTAKFGAVTQAASTAWIQATASGHPVYAGILSDKIDMTILKVPAVQNFDYTGTASTITLPTGRYKLEVWGAQGGGSEDGNDSSGYGGRGGYAVGTLNLTAASTTLYVYVGGKGGNSTNGVAAGGWNGGGSGYGTDVGDPGNGGGGASDIRIGEDTLYHRVIVAGGGGGGGEDMNDSYGHGGGTESIMGSYSGYEHYAATQIAPGLNGTFGMGATTNMGDGGGGGGGWYGGGTSSKTLEGDDTNGGGGGSGFVYDDNSTEAVNSVLTQTGTAYALTDEYKLSDANTIGGHTTIPAPNGGTESGHMGHGYARISLIYP